MQKRDNPYTPGAGRKPRTLAGREDDVDAFTALVERLGAGSFERSLVYTGLPRQAWPTPVTPSRTWSTC